MASFPILRTVEDLVVVGGVAVTAWQSTHSAQDVVTAVAAAPVVRSGLALLLSKGSSSGLVETLSLLRRAVALLTSQPAQVVGETVLGAPAPTADPATGRHMAAGQ